MALSLDHVGLAGFTGTLPRAQFMRLGFHLTDPQDLLPADAPGRPEPAGQRSCHAVFQQGYVELTEVNAGDPGHHLAAFLRRGPGLHIAAFAVTDVAAEHRRCTAAGLPCTPVAWASRDIVYGERHGRARFEWFMIRNEAAPEGLLCFVRNHTPELVYQPEVMTHANGVHSLRAVIVACRDPAEAARRYERILAVRAAAVDSDQVLQLDVGAVILREQRRCAQLWGTGTNAAQDCFAAARLGARDVAQAADWLKAQELPFVLEQDRLLIPAAQAGGAGLELESD